MKPHSVVRHLSQCGPSCTTFLILLLTFLLVECGGGGGGGANQEWISITGAMADSQNANISGRATSDSAVTWINKRSNTIGQPSQQVVTTCFILCSSVNVWQATIPLIQGANQIIFTASGQGGNAETSLTIAWGATFPRVLSTMPIDQAYGVSATSITANFSEAMDPSTINATTFTLHDNGTINYNPYGTPVSGTVTYSGTTATFTPSTALTTSHAYEAKITTGVKNLAGYPMLNSYIWDFSN